MVGLMLAAMCARAAADDCADASAALKSGDLTRARQLVDACPDGDPAHAKVDKAIAAKGYSQVTIVTKPEGLAVALDQRPELAVKGGDELWLPAGTYTFTAGGMQSTVQVKKAAHAVVLLEVPDAKPPPSNGTVDFGDEGGGEVVNGPPPKIVHPSLIPDRYQKILNAKPRENALEDQPAIPGPRWPDRAFAIEAGLGDSRSALAISAAAIVRVDWLQLEAAWLRRGVGDELALPALARHWLFESDDVKVSGGVGGQGELRLDDGVSRFGVSAIASLDAELRHTGAIVDVRGELGSTWAIGLRVGVAF